MSCLSKLNRSRLAALRCGISSTAARAVYLATANRGALLFGALSGAAAAAGKGWLDNRHYRRQAIASAAYKRLLDGVGQLAMQAAAAKEPQLRQGIMSLAAARLAVIESVDYAGLNGTLKQRFRQQHRVVASWLEQAAAAETERGPTRAFVLGAAQAGKFGMKSFITPAPPPPSPQAALRVGIAVGIVTATLYAAGQVTAGRQQASKAAVPTRRSGTAAANVSLPAAVQLQPVKNSSMVSAAGYDPAARTLALTFRSSHKTYLYRGVPAGVAKEFLETGKKGRFFHQQIRGRYRAVRLDEKP